MVNCICTIYTFAGVVCCTLILATNTKHLQFVQFQLNFILHWNQVANGTCWNICTDKHLLLIVYFIHGCVVVSHARSKFLLFDSLHFDEQGSNKFHPMRKKCAVGLIVYHVDSPSGRIESWPFKLWASLVAWIAVGCVLLCRRPHCEWLA